MDKNNRLFRLVPYRAEDMTEEMKRSNNWLYYRNGILHKEYPDGRIEKGSEITWKELEDFIDNSYSNQDLIDAAGTLTEEEAQKALEEIKKSREEWD